MRLSIVPSSAASLENQLAAIKGAGFTEVELTVADATRLQPALAAAGVKVSCLLTSISLDQRDAEKWQASLAEISAALKVSAENNIPCVRILPGQLAKGQSATAATSVLGARLADLVPLVTETAVGVAIQNAGGFALASNMWQLLETVTHPLIGVCLDLAATSLSGESPVLAIPTLNSRILHVRVWDYKDGKAAPLGTGDAKIKIALERLRGIGYEGAISLAPPAGVDTADVASLKPIAHQLGLWTGLIEPPKPVEPAKPAPAAAKPAAPAAKPVAPAAVPSTPPIPPAATAPSAPAAP
jgi:sugar phosphate isomerase/epimerase